MTAFVGMFPTQSAYPNVPFNGATVNFVDKTFNAAKLPATLNGVTTTAASGDTYRFLPIAKGTMVLAVGLEVLVVDAGGGTISVGDSAGGTTFHTTKALSSLANFVSAASTWKTYTAVDYLLLTIGTASLTTAKFRVWAITANVSQADYNLIPAT